MSDEILIMSDEILTVNNVVKRYGNIVPVDRVSFSVRPGEILGFLGPNGAGKTTTIRMIMGITAPDEGEVRFHGLGAPRAKSPSPAWATCLRSGASTRSPG